MMMDTKCPGRLSMEKKVKFGVPRNTVSAKSGSITKADSRGKDCPLMGKGK